MTPRLSVDTPVRLSRSFLTLPASNARFLEKARESEADIVVLDLEDSVPPDEKAKARKTAVDALNDMDWSGKTVCLRPNGWDTDWTEEDLLGVLPRTADKIDLILMPKVETAEDIHKLETVVSKVETENGWSKVIGFELLIESALAMVNAESIASASARNEGLHFGPGDFAASVGARSTAIGDFNPEYALMRILVAARAFGLHPMDGAFGNFKDMETYETLATQAAKMGFEGKWCIHPGQIEPANRIFTPAREEVDKAQRILDALREAEKEGKAAVVLDGEMIDVASIKQAQVLVRKAELALA